VQAESIEALIGRSSLGGSGARKLRSRTSVSTVQAVRRQAGLEPKNQGVKEAQNVKEQQPSCSSQP